MHDTVHVPVLLQEIIKIVGFKLGDIVFDGTLGGGGYAEKISQIIGSNGVLIGTDLDADAITRVGSKNFISLTHFYNKPFSDVDLICDELGVTLDAAVLDLGLSSDQLEQSKRGFSFKDESEPLLMSFSSNPTDEDTTASEILNNWSEESIADVLYGFGGERYSRRIAKNIVEQRIENPISTVGDLVAIINRSVPSGYRHKKTHPATKTFQALRIATNSEWQHLESFLQKVYPYITSGGHIAIVSFHSGEDRKVKQTFRAWEQEGKGHRITKKPIKPTEEEISANPRSRSAVLRIFQTN